MTYHLGVDLGTTFTAAAVARDGRAEPVTLGPSSVAVPSVVYLGSELVVGHAAARRATTEPGRVAREFKRRIGDPTPLIVDGAPVPAEMLAARVVAWVVDQVAATEGSAPEGVTLCHPANWGEYKLDLLRQAVRHAGVPVDHLLPEPVAAATFYASQRELAPGTVVAVYDLGGGTFDATLVQQAGDGFRIIGQPDGLERVGGIDFDHAVLRHVTGAAGLDLDRADVDDPAVTAAVTQLRQACVDAKEALSSDTDVRIPVMLPDLHTEVRLTRAELEEMVRPAIGETLVALRRAVASAGIGPEQVHAVLLVGGSSRIPLVSQQVTAELNRPVAVDARPKDAVPLGAALASEARARAPAGAPATPPAPTPPTPAAVSTPSPGNGEGAAPEAAGRSRPSRRALGWAAAVLALVAAAGIAAVALAADDDGSGTATTTTTAPDLPTDSTTSPTTSPTTTAGDAGNGGLTDDLMSSLGDGLISGPAGEPMDPLPGEDWSPEARTQFVADCTPAYEPYSDIAGMDAGSFCGCLYDDIEDSDLSFGDFNEAWSAESDDQLGREERAALESATFTCMGLG